MGNHASCKTKVFSAAWSGQSRWILGTWLMLFILAAPPCLAGGSLSTAFTYQGQLKDGANPANGTYDFRFLLYDADIGGSQVGPILYQDDKPVAGGLVNLELDFGATPFDGRALYLEVAVRPGTTDNTNRTDSSYTKLTSRQKLTATPYALLAQTVPSGSLTTDKLASGAVTSGNLASGAVLSDKLATGAVTGDKIALGTISPDKLSLPFQLTGANGLAILGGVNTQAGGIGVKGFNSISNMIGYLGTGSEGIYGESLSDNGIGVHGVANHGTLTYGVKGESNIYGVFGTGSQGVRGENPTSGDYGWLGSNGFGAVGYSATGTGVFGESRGTDKSGVYGQNDKYKSFGWCGGGITQDAVLGAYPLSVGVYGQGVADYTDPGGNYVLSAGVYGKSDDYGVAGTGKNYGVFGHAAGGTWSEGVHGESYDQNGYGVYGMHFYSGNANYGILGNPISGIYATANHSMSVPANTAALMASLSMPAAQGNIIIGMYYSTNQFRVDGTGKVFANGGTQTGGADVAEFIPVSGAPQPGDVVEIDLDHPGSFRRCATANSTAVAGVISTDPGMSLGADKPAENTATGPQLALAGRVPVKVCAAGGPIHTGDLLVGSAVAGRAMRAPANPAVGTVIGKALGTLDSGEGTIEMLAMLR
jgi:hypothetical protein